MGISVKKELVKFCPFCGGGVVTHIGEGAFVCGHKDSQKEAEDVLPLGIRRCNRSFRVLLNIGISVVDSISPAQYKKDVKYKLHRLQVEDLKK